MYTPNTHIHDRALARLGIDKSIKSGGVSCLGMPMPNGNNTCIQICI
jgi:hypothetical protein